MNDGSSNQHVCEYLGAKGTWGCEGMRCTRQMHSLQPLVYIHPLVSSWLEVRDEERDLFYCMYRGTSLIRNSPPPWATRHRALGMA